MRSPDHTNDSKCEQQDTSCSPNWNRYHNWPAGACIEQGFPCDEGWPEGGPFGNEHTVYEVITLDGARHDARVDYTTQYRAEGLQWRTKEGKALGKQVVVAWKRKA